MNFLFGCSFNSLEPRTLDDAENQSGAGTTGNWVLSLDYSMGFQSWGSDLGRQERLLASFGALFDESLSNDTVATSLAERTIVCHAAVGAGGVRDPIRAKYGFDIVSTKIADAVGMVSFFKNGQSQKEKDLNEVLWARQFNGLFLLLANHFVFQSPIHFFLSLPGPDSYFYAYPNPHLTPIEFFPFFIRAYSFYTPPTQYLT